MPRQLLVGVKKVNDQTNSLVLRIKDVEARLGISRSVIYALMRFNPKRPRDYDPTFPRPISIGANSVGWIASEIDAWIASRIAKRDATPPLPAPTIAPRRRGRPRKVSPIDTPSAAA